MLERQLLLFPTPEVASRSNLGGGSGRLSLPTHRQQRKNLAPKFVQLQEAVRSRNIDIQKSMAGIDPEQALVMETVGSIERFSEAVRRINGFEWMGEFEIDGIHPDQKFFDKNHPEKELSGRIYMIMTNQRALNEILSLWNQYAAQDNPQQRFPRGLTKFRDVFLRLKDIHRWGVKDRLLETGVVDAWKEDLKHDGNRIIRFEIELWFRDSEEKRLQSSVIIRKLIGQLSGHVLAESVHEGIAYHGMLAELPANTIQDVIDNPNTELVKCDNIMFFRPVGQILAGDRPLGDEVTPFDPGEQSLPDGDPVIAILDGLPLANHQLLKGRLIIDDPDNVESSYNTNERLHGTSMASLIVNGDLNDGMRPLRRPVYVRPIMQPVLEDVQTPRREHIPDDVLLVDLIHRSVKRLFEGDGPEGSVAPSVRIINLSLGDPNRPFLHSMSPVARLLDWLSSTYNVLFVVSAGNHPESIKSGISRTEFESLSDEERESTIVKALFADARNRKILSPAESINGLTVGSVQHDNSDFGNSSYKFNPFMHTLPSPVSAFGSGHRGAIKPDIVFPGGKVLYDEDIKSSRVDDYIIIPSEPSIRVNPPGNKIAIPDQRSGNLRGTAYSCGTSNATALISRSVGICYDSLQRIFAEQVTDINTRDYEAPLLKAMLVHGCTSRRMSTHIEELLNTSGRYQQISGLVSRWTGYGIPQVDRVLGCTDQRASLLGFGQLSDGEAHVFRLPLPPSLGSQPEWRCLTVTMAWLSPIAAKTQRYRVAGVWFEVKKEILGVERKGICSKKTGWWHAVKRGTVQHEVFEGKSPAPFIDGNTLEVKVNCRKDAGEIRNPVTYGLAASLEVAEETKIAVYNEIRDRVVPTAIQIQ